MCVGISDPTGTQSKLNKPSKLFIAQGGCWVDAHCPAGGDVGRQKRGQRKQEGHADQCQRVSRSNAKKKRRHESVMASDERIMPLMPETLGLIVGAPRAGVAHAHPDRAFPSTPGVAKTIGNCPPVVKVIRLSPG